MKLFQKLFTAFSVLTGIAILAATACNKSSDTNNEKEKVSVFLTDDAGLFDNVFIDVRYVEVKVQEGHKNREHVGEQEDDDDDHFDDNDKDSDNDRQSRDQYGKWDTLTIRPGVYDILKLKNGVDTLFAQGAVNGRVRKIRLTLGNNNSIVRSGVTIPLTLHPAINNYVYVRIHNRHHEPIGLNHHGFWIDFDIANSIVEQNGRFFLRPLIKPFCNKQFGQVSGKVFPADAHPVIKIYNTNGAGAAIAEKSGEYKIRGLAEGTYKVTFTGENGYVQTTLNDIKVVKDKETKIPEVTLRK
jgi:hypothetical protein